MLFRCAGELTRDAGVAVETDVDAGLHHLDEMVEARRSCPGLPMQRFGRGERSRCIRPWRRRCAGRPLPGRRRRRHRTGFAVVVGDLRVNRDEISMRHRRPRPWHRRAIGPMRSRRARRGREGGVADPVGGARRERGEVLVLPSRRTRSRRPRHQGHSCPAANCSRAARPRAVRCSRQRTDCWRGC